MRTAYLVSLKYSPIFLMICRERARVIQARLPVTMLLSRGYAALGGAGGQTRYLTTSTSAASMVLDTAILSTLRAPALFRLFRYDPPALVLFENPHPANVVVAVLAKLACRDTLVVPVLHEPYKADKRVYGLSKSVYISLVELCQSALIRLAGAVVVPSTTAAGVFAGRYADFKRPVIRIPLPFERCETPEGDRRYVSFLGHAVKVKGIGRFFQLVECAAELSLPYQFQIATSSNIDAYLAALSAEARARLRVINETTLQDVEIQRAAANSICVLALYETVMQSAVAPVAFMHGTPVIATDLPGLLEVVADHETGVIVAQDASMSDIFEAIDSIQNNLAQMEVRCREAFERHYGDEVVRHATRALLDLVHS